MFLSYKYLYNKNANVNCLSKKEIDEKLADHYKKEEMGAL